eukprot:CAMPEP_0201943854 /NCGR_PEP_ID=MMETSP0903-20130614/51978_1 /ASSEMBLY_ACC=CAM_ASM_000552 /TAXON_ID=420261 /ORGANISM="Thalassiosira antarctica, Strain CCMP982" /LENGTH=846 /DNA_ID=CAMNT_0048486691 /DNA_START=32 /DNA_END=2569 /DNA_ORIENTATION=+
MAAPSQQPPPEIIDLVAEEEAAAAMQLSPPPSSHAPSRAYASSARAAPARVSMLPEPTTDPAATTPPPQAGRTTRSSLRGNDANMMDILSQRYCKTACDIFDNFLKKRKGWKSSNGGELANWMFYPGSLVGCSVAEIKNKGKGGVHYAYDWEELGKMIETYGVLHAPKSLQDFPSELPRSERRSLEAIDGILFGTSSEPKPAKAVTPNSGVRAGAAPENTKANESDNSSNAASESTNQGSSNKPSENTKQSSSNKRKADNAGSVSKEGKKKKKKKTNNPTATSNTAAAARLVSSSSGTVPAAETVRAGGTANKRPQEREQRQRTSKKPTALMATALKEIQKQCNNITKAAADSEKESEKLMAEKKKIAKVNADLEKNVEKLKAGNGRFEDEKKQMEKKCERLIKENENKVNGIGRLKDKSDRLKEERDKLKVDCTSKDDEIRVLNDECKRIKKEFDESQKLVHSLQRRLVRNDAAEQRQFDASEVQQQGACAVAQSVRSEENDVNEDDKKLRDILRGTIVEGNVHWDSVAGLQKVKESLKVAAIAPIKFPSVYAGERKAFKGILLYGPPGTGKSYLAKAAATALSKEVDCTFFSISAADIDSKWKGDSSRLVKNLFEMARECRRAVIFIDEVDSLCGTRDGICDVSDQRIVTEFLKQMDGGGDEGANVLVIGATNLPWNLDTAMLRRFEKRIYVPLPDKEARLEMFKIHLGVTPNILKDDDFEKLAQLTDGASGADIQVLVKKEALMEAVNEGNRAQHFLPVGDFYMPVSSCEYCPQQLSTDPSNIDCKYCGAKMMSLFDVPDDKLKVRDVSMADFVKFMKPSHSTVAAGQLQQYTEWTEAYGEVG